MSPVIALFLRALAAAVLGLAFGVVLPPAPSQISFVAED